MTVEWNLRATKHTYLRNLRTQAMKMTLQLATLFAQMAVHQKVEQERVQIQLTFQLCKVMIRYTRDVITLMMIIKVAVKKAQEHVKTLLIINVQAKSSGLLPIKATK